MNGWFDVIMVFMRDYVMGEDGRYIYISIDIEIYI